MNIPVTIDKSSPASSLKNDTRPATAISVKSAHIAAKLHNIDPRAEYPGQPQRLIYCVHGNPEGCCVSVLGTKNTGDALRTIKLDNEEYHCHGKSKSNIDKKARKKLWLAAMLCLVFMICEVIGGYMSGSLAIATDAAHLLTDFVSFMISIVALWVASRPATKKMPFGWYRAEVVGALISVLMIWVVTGILLYIATKRLITRNFDIDEKVMLYTSIFGLVVNILMGCTLHPHTHSHGGDSHSHEGETHGNGGETHSHGGQGNLNVRVAFIHVIGDILQSFGVFVAAVIIYFKPDCTIVDPICTFLFAILVLGTTITILRDVMTVLMEGIPRSVRYSEVVETFTAIEGVQKVHNLRIWALSLDKAALSAHIAVKPGANTRDLLNRVSKLLASKFGFFEMTLQIEEMNASMAGCERCQSPLSQVPKTGTNP